MNLTPKQIAKMIDHTILAPNIRSEDIVRLCKEADSYQFASVCVNPSFVALAAECLKNSETKVCTVIGFPLGAVTTEDKIKETENAVLNSCDEVDMVIDISSELEGNLKNVKEDISGVVTAASRSGKHLGKKIIVKVILETCYLDDETIRQCCICAKEAGADFVKTSTGFGTPKDSNGTLLPNGATVHHIKLMRDTVGSDMGVKASGGIRSAEQAKAMIEAGATRIGTSSGIKIMETWN